MGGDGIEGEEDIDAIGVLILFGIVLVVSLLFFAIISTGMIKLLKHSPQGVLMLEVGGEELCVL